MKITERKIRNIISKILSERGEFKSINRGKEPLSLGSVGISPGNTLGIGGDQYHKFKSSEEAIALDTDGVFYKRRIGSRKDFEPISNPADVIRYTDYITSHKKYKNLEVVKIALENLASRRAQSIKNLEVDRESKKDFDKVYEYFNPTKKQFFKINSAIIDAGSRKFYPFPEVDIKGSKCRYTSFMKKRKLTVKGKEYDRYHKGVDIAGAVGTPIFANADGNILKISKGKKDSGAGKMIVISHGNYVTTYMHMNDFAKKRYNKDNAFTSFKSGDPVKAGEIIGFLGNTGGSTGPHLHFEVKQPGNTHFGGNNKRGNKLRIEKMKELGGIENAGSKNMTSNTLTFVNYEILDNDDVTL